MKIFLITYDLLSSEKDYRPLYNSIKELNGYAHTLESVWFVSVDKSVNVTDIYNRLKPLIDSRDRLFVVDITGQEMQGWLSKDTWNWFKKIYNDK